jgi:hypothetical protein
MIRQRSGFFQRPLLEVLGDAGCSETVVAELGPDGGCSGAASDDRIDFLRAAPYE